MDEVDWTVVYIYRNYGCGIGNVFLFDDAMFPHICCTLKIQEKIEEDNFNGLPVSATVLGVCYLGGFVLGDLGKFVSLLKL